MTDNIAKLAGKGCGGTLIARKKHVASLRFAGYYLEDLKQSETTDKLNALINLMDRHLREHGPGPAN